jgi:uncharacterized damage-inducible protein DinB
MNPQQAKAVADALLADFASEIPLTVGVFNAVPPDRLDFRPDPLSKTALGLLRHLTLEDEWLLGLAAGEPAVAFPDDSDACGLMTPADAAAEYEKRMTAILGRLRALSGEDLLREVDMLGIIRMPAVNFISLALRHSCHHRGQLSTYLRPMGSKVPGIYGPTADTVTATA